MNPAPDPGPWGPFTRPRRGTTSRSSCPAAVRTEGEERAGIHAQPALGPGLSQVLAEEPGSRYAVVLMDTRSRVDDVIFESSRAWETWSST
jgi:hypothetical protein